MASQRKKQVLGTAATTKRKHSKPHRSVTKILPHEPKNERDKLFCERWLVHFDHQRAYREAGFKVTRQHSASRALNKLHNFRPYLQRLRPAADKVVALAIGRERVDVIKSIEHIGTANVLDYVEMETVHNEKTGMLEPRLVLKPLCKLTREQASAIDTVAYDFVHGRLSYTLPSARTRLKALTTLGEQLGHLKRKDDVPVLHNHLHLHAVPLDKIKGIKALLMEAVGPQVVREVLGIQPEDQGQ